MIQTSSPATAAASRREIRVPNHDLSAADILEIVKVLRPEPKPERWFSKYSATIVVAVLGLAGTIYVNTRPEPIDCVAYVQMLGELRASIDPASVDDVFHDGGIDFGRVEDECGPPEPLLTAE